MKELLAILEQMNHRIGTLEMTFEGRDFQKTPEWECYCAIENLRQLTKGIPDYLAAFRPQEVSR